MQTKTLNMGDVAKKPAHKREATVKQQHDAALKKMRDTWNSGSATDMLETETNMAIFPSV